MKIIKEQDLDRLHNFTFLGFVNGGRQFVVSMNHAKFGQLEPLPSKRLLERDIGTGLQFMEYCLRYLKDELVLASAEFLSGGPEFKKGYNLLFKRLVRDPEHPKDTFVLYYDALVYASMPFIKGSRPDNIVDNDGLFSWLDTVLDNSEGLEALEEHPIAAYYPYYFVRAFTGGFKPYKKRVQRMSEDPDRIFRIYWDSPNSQAKLVGVEPAKLIEINLEPITDISKEDFEILLDYQARNN